MKPLHSRVSGERNYCFICQLRINYNVDKIYKIARFPNIINTYILLKEENDCLNQGYEQLWF